MGSPAGRSSVSSAKNESQPSRPFCSRALSKSASALTSACLSASTEFFGAANDADATAKSRTAMESVSFISSPWAAIQLYLVAARFAQCLPSCGAGFRSGQSRLAEELLDEAMQLSERDRLREKDVSAELRDARDGF